MSGQPASPDLDLLQTILRRCAEAAPEPWYPRTYAETTGVSRDSLDLPLEQLRLAGLVRLTDWIQGRGQGYALTPDGARILESPRQLTRLRDGKLPVAVNGPEEPPPLHHPGTRLYQQRTQLREELENAGPPMVTRFLLFANIAVFLWGLSLAADRGIPQGFYLNGGMLSIFSATPDPNDANRAAYHVLLHDLGALHASDLVAGEWWRLLSCCFVHRGLAHLGMNMYALYILGQIVEKMWGRWRFLFIYLTAGLGGSCTAVLVAPLGGMLVGASGAICGLLASVAAWIFLNRRLLTVEFITAWKRNLIVNFVLLVIISAMPSVSWQGHLGGAVVGLIVSVPLNFQRFAAGWLRWLALAAALAVPVACLGAVAYARAHGKDWETLKIRFRQEQRQKEVADFLERIDPPRRKAEKKARAAQEAAEKLLEEAPQGRFEREVKPAVAALAEAQSELGGAAKATAAAGPYQSPDLEEWRSLSAQYLEARAKLCALAETLLTERRHFAGEDREAFQQQWARVEELRGRLPR